MEYSTSIQRLPVPGAPFWNHWCLGNRIVRLVSPVGKFHRLEQPSPATFSISGDGFPGHQANTTGSVRGPEGCIHFVPDGLVNIH